MLAPSIAFQARGRQPGNRPRLTASASSGHSRQPSAVEGGAPSTSRTSAGVSAR
jgi:hypothetical protein